MRLQILLSYLLLCGIHSISYAQLFPDSTFSQDGYFIQTDSNNSISGSRVMQLGDGSILVAGTFNGEFRLRKYDALGNPAMGFGTNGSTSIPALDAEPGNVNFIFDIDTTHDQKITVLAELSEMNISQFDSSKSRIVLVRFNGNGSIDNTFNGSGYLVDQPVSNYYYYPKAMAIDKLGNKNQIYVGSVAYEVGHASCPMGYGRWCVTKYNNNGTRETGFNTTGILQDDASAIKQATAQTPMATIYDMRVMPSGHLTVAGALHYVESAFFAFRLSPNGQWDNSFGSNGRHTHPVGFQVPTNDLTNSQVLTDGSSVFYSCLRYFGSPDSTVLSVVKSDASGNSVNTFGTGGTLTTSYLSGQYPILIFKSDLSFLLSYYRKYGAQFADQKIEFKRFQVNGSPDMGFGIQGICKTQPRTPDDYINQSQVLHGIWTKNETGLFLACTNQPWGIGGNGSGIFKYKWPGLTPLNSSLVESANVSTIYPNPAFAHQSILIENEQEISTIHLFNLQGARMPVNFQHLSANKVSMALNATLQPGLYFVLINQKEISKIVIQ